MAFSAAAMARLQYDCNASKIQYAEEHATEIHAPVGGGDITVTSADLIAMVPELYVWGSCGIESRPVAADDFLAKVDIDVVQIGQPTEGGAVTSSSHGEVYDVVPGGVSQTHSGGGSKTYGEIMRRGFYYPVPFAQAVIEEGSTLMFSFIVSGPPETLE